MILKMILIKIKKNKNLWNINSSFLTRIIDFGERGT
jgi:hypothetical protein